MEKHTRENLEGNATDLHEQILAHGQERFPEESYRLLLQAGASPVQALSMLGYPRPSSAPGAS